MSNKRNVIGETINERKEVNGMETNSTKEIEIEGMPIALLIKKLGSDEVLKMINSRLVHERWNVEYAFMDVDEKILAKPEQDLLISLVQLVLPKKDGWARTLSKLRGIGIVIDVDEDAEDDENETHITYLIELPTSYNQLTMRAIILSINEVEIPWIEKELARYGITDYWCTFGISRKHVPVSTHVNTNSVQTS